jgi:uncharacterized protein (DUF1330 family)
MPDAYIIVDMQISDMEQYKQYMEAHRQRLKRQAANMSFVVDALKPWRATGSPPAWRC